MSGSFLKRTITRRHLARSATLVGGAGALALLHACGGSSTKPESKAPSPQPSAAGPQRGGTLVTARSGLTASLDPHLEAAELRARVSVLLYNGLVRMDNEGSMAPDLAASWETPDATTYVFKLRTGVKWHDGQEFVGDDVKYTLNRLLDEKTGSAGRTEFTPIKSIETADRQGVRVTTSEPFAALLASLGGKYGAIVPEAAIKQHGDLKKAAVGTGPFALEEWVPQSHLKLKRNAAYFRQNLPYFDTIEWRLVPDEANIVAGLRGGTYQHATIEDRNLATLLKNEKSLTVYTAPVLGTDSIWMNTNVEPLGMVKVRQAISLAIDRQAVIRAAVAGFGVLSGPVPPAQKQYALPENELAQLYKRDVDRAKALLAEAGLANGFKLDLWAIGGYPVLASGAQVVAANLKDVGIDVKIETVESGVWIDRFTKGQYPATMNTGGGLVDPDIWFRYAHSAPAGRDWQALNDPELDTLLERGRTTLDPARRADIYKELQRTMIRKGSIIILYAPQQVDIASNTVKGLTQHPTGWSYGLEAAWLEK
jgi:peptide/nickel transport system substrate-binding protein